MICTRQHIYAIECKNLFGDIEIDDKGNFIRRFNFGKFYKREGLYSPVTQNERHLNVLREVRRDAKTGSFLGLAEKVFDENFSSNYKSIVVLANPKTVLNDKKAPKNIREHVIRADQLVAFIKNMDNSRNADWSDSSMLETMQYFLNCNRPNKSDYARKYEDIYLMSVIGKIKEERGIHQLKKFAPSAENLLSYVLRKKAKTQAISSGAVAVFRNAGIESKIYRFPPVTIKILYFLEETSAFSILRRTIGNRQSR